MTLYEINKQIADAIEYGFDADTGEILDEEALDDLQMARDDKIENIVLAIKNYKAEADAVKAEKNNLANRQRMLENRVEWLKRYLTVNMEPGEKLSTPKMAISWRKSEVVEVTDLNALPEKFLKYKDPEPDKTSIKTAIKAGEIVPGADLFTRNNIQIK